MDSTRSLPSSLLHRLELCCIATIFLSFIYVLTTCTYNTFFHPLRNLPGPPLARLSKLWSRIGNFYGRKSHLIHAAHQTYGPVVRIGPNEISFANPQAVREIYTSDHFVKEESFYRAKKIYHENHLMSTQNPEAHRKRRKLLSRGFSQAAMLEFEPDMTTKIQAMFDHWARLTRRPTDGAAPASINIYPWAHWVAFDIVYHLMFDEDPGSVRDGHEPALMPYVRAWRPTFIYKELIPQLEQWGPYVPGPVGGYFRKVRDWKEMAVKIIRDCRARGTTTPLLRSVLKGEKDEFLGREVSDSELAEECMGGMFGGSGTTANTFVYVLWGVLRDEKIKARLVEEVRGSLSQSTGEVPLFSDCTGLPYLQAVINETLRLYPTIIATLPRTATVDTVIAGTPVPAGTIVGTQNLSVHRDASAFPNPDTFQPERWLDPGRDQARLAAWNPFSVGSRKCIGINLAQMELSKLVAAFFLRFDASIDPSMREADMDLFDNFSASPVGGRLVLRLREVVAIQS